MMGKIKKHFGGVTVRATALCLALCFVLGAAFSGVAWAESYIAIAPGNESVRGNRYFKKEWPPYFYERVMFYKLATDLSEAFFALSPEYYRDDETLNNLQNQHYRTSACMLNLWGMPFAAERYIYEHRLTGVRQLVAWQALGGVLEPLYRYQAACLRQDRQSLETFMRHRQESDFIRKGEAVSQGEVQTIINCYKNMEDFFTAMADALQVELAKNLRRMPLEISQAFVGGGGAAGLHAGQSKSEGRGLSEAMFRDEVRQKRLTIDEQLEEIIAHAGTVDAEPFAACLPIHNRDDIDRSLSLAEACIQTVCSQLETDHRLSPEFRDVADAAVKSVGNEFFTELLQDLNISFEVSAKYFKPTIPVYRESLDLLRLLRRHVDEHGK